MEAIPEKIQIKVRIRFEDLHLISNRLILSAM